MALRADPGRREQGDLVGPIRQLIDQHIPVGASCLEVGCGDGSPGGEFLHRTGRRYVGVDVSAQGVRQACARGLDARLLDEQQRLPFENASFDAAVCIEVLEHLFLPLETASEICRVLKPGGVLIATTPNVAYIKRRLELGFQGIWNPLGDSLSVAEPWRDPHIRFFTPRTLKRMLLQSGFAEVSVEGHQGVIEKLRQRTRITTAPRFVPARYREQFVELSALRLHAVAQKAM